MRRYKTAFAILHFQFLISSEMHNERNHYNGATNYVNANSCI